MGNTAGAGSESREPRKHLRLSHAARRPSGARRRGACHHPDVIAPRVAIVAADRRWPLALAAAVVLARLYVLVAADPIYDDAFITWRVARNLASGLGPVFHAGERVQVVTSLPHTALCALWFALFGGAGMTVDRALACVCDGAACYALACLISDHTALQRPARTVAMGAFALYYALVLHAALVIPGGLETGLYVATAAWALWEAGRGHALRAGAWAGACALVRPEGCLVALAIAIGARSRSTALRVGLVAALLALPGYAAAGLYYGSLIPQSVVAKSQLVHSPRVEWAGIVRAFAWGDGQIWFGAVAAWGAARALMLRGFAPVALWGALLGGCLATFTSLWPWYYAPLSLCFAACFGVGAGSIHAALCSLGYPRVARAGLTAGGALTVFLLVRYGASELWEAGYRRAASRRQDELVARALVAHAGPGARILAERVGVLAFASGLSFHDYPGLTSARVTDALGALRRPVGFGPGDTEALAAVLRAVAPSHLVLRRHELEAARDSTALQDYAEVARFAADPRAARSSAEHTDLVVLARRSGEAAPAQWPAP